MTKKKRLKLNETVQKRTAWLKMWFITMAAWIVLFLLCFLITFSRGRSIHINGQIIRLLHFHNSRVRPQSLNNFCVYVLILEHNKIVLPSIEHSDTSSLGDLYCQHTEKHPRALREFLLLKARYFADIKKWDILKMTELETHHALITTVVIDSGKNHHWRLKLLGEKLLENKIFSLKISSHKLL